MGVARAAGAWIAALGAVGLVAGCGVEGTPAPVITPNQQPDRSGVFAYRTEGELVVVRGAETLRASGNFGYSAAPVNFTRDGAFAFAVETASKTLVALSVDNGSVTRTECDCTDAVALRDAVVGWWREPGQIMSQDLAGTTPAEPERDIVLPDSPSPLSGGNWDGARLVAATDEYVLLARSESRGLWWEKNHLYAIGSDAILPLGRVPGIDSELSAAAGPDGHTFVLAGATARSSSCGIGFVATIDVRSNAVSDLPSVPGECSTVYNPRWGGDNVISVAVRKWADVAGATSTVDRLRSAAQGWAPVAEQPVIDMLARSEQTVIQVVGGEPLAARDTPHGVLVVEKGGARSELATEVVSLGSPI
ncbi:MULTISPECIES: hypothetical protein [Nocardia]|uniref:hypothetical protein n=1 Tax=Nocardia TaxID=1817 RepID=UPI0015EE6536|nr:MULTISPECIES: hypothetical protein [Nocardia]MCA2206076.1 hypothetical protein [Nocardia rosealba]